MSQRLSFSDRYSIRLKTIWIIVAHRTGAKIFASNGPGRGIILVEERKYPHGRLKDRQLRADRPGRTFSLVGSERHSYGRENEAHDHEMSSFAKELSAILDGARARNRFDELVIVAEPKFLGVLRSMLDESTEKRVLKMVAKGLTRISEKDLMAYINQTLKAS